jgi:hypothetical protein
MTGTPAPAEIGIDCRIPQQNLAPDFGGMRFWLCCAISTEPSVSR